MIQPAANQQIDKEAAERGVRFAWKRPSVRGTFKLTVALSPRFDRVFRTVDAYALQHAMVLPPGEYFWKVTLTEGGRELASSDTGSFTVTAAPDPPRMISPGKATIVDMSRRDSLTFTWQGSEGARNYILRVYQLEGGRKKVFERVVAGTRFDLRDLSVLDKGRFAWSLQAMGAGGRNAASEESFHDFVITLGKDLSSPEVTSPEIQFVD